jgi:hypothetical protein
MTNKDNTMGFANPIDLLRFREAHDTNDVTDAMLMLLTQTEPRPVTEFLIMCTAEKFASFNTVNKYLMQLISMRFIKSEASDDDQRLRVLSVTVEGRRYLNDWAAGGAVRRAQGAPA